MKAETLNSHMSARSSLLPDYQPNPFDGGGIRFERQLGTSDAYVSELHACERHHGRRLLADDKPLLDQFLQAKRVELGLDRLPLVRTTCPGASADGHQIPDTPPTTQRSDMTVRPPGRLLADEKARSGTPPGTVTR